MADEWFNCIEGCDCCPSRAVAEEQRKIDAEPPREDGARRFAVPNGDWNDIYDMLDPGSYQCTMRRAAADQVSVFNAVSFEECRAEGLKQGDKWRSTKYWNDWHAKEDARILNLLKLTPEQEAELAVRDAAMRRNDLVTNATAFVAAFSFMLAMGLIAHYRLGGPFAVYIWLVCMCCGYLSAFAPFWVRDKLRERWYRLRLEENKDGD